MELYGRVVYVVKSSTTQMYIYIELESTNVPESQIHLFSKLCLRTIESNTGAYQYSGENFIMLNNDDNLLVKFNDLEHTLYLQKFDLQTVFDEQETYQRTLKLLDKVSIFSKAGDFEGVHLIDNFIAKDNREWLIGYTTRNLNSNTYCSFNLRDYVFIK